jgi:Flp pilus assembly protein TadG
MSSMAMRASVTGRRLLDVFSRRERHGMAAVEFALFATIFLTIFASIVDIGGALYGEFQLESAIAGGAQYAIANAANVDSTNGPTLASDVANIVANGNGNGWADVTVVVNNGPTVTITNGTPSTSGTPSNADKFYCLSGTPPNWTWSGSTTTPGTACAGGGVTGAYVTITATRAVTALFPVSFGHLQNGTISQNAAVETQ